MILNPWTNNLIAKGLVKTQKVQLWWNVKNLLHSILLVAFDKPYIPDIDSFGCYDLGLGLAKGNILGWLLDDGLVRFSQLTWLWMCLLGTVSNNQNGNLRWFLPLGVDPPPLNGTNFQTFFYPTFFLLQSTLTYRVSQKKVPFKIHLLLPLKFPHTSISPRLLTCLHQMRERCHILFIFFQNLF